MTNQPTYTHSSGVNPADRITKAIDIAARYGGANELHHLHWVVDQMVRVLAGDQYDTIVADTCDGEDGPDTYKWDVGIAP